MLLSLPLIISIILVLAVIFVNGWTDAPNAIATAVSTRCLTPRSAVLLAVVFNALGAGVMTLFNAKVAETISNMVRFESDATGSNDALIVLAASLAAIVIWATAAWYFGIPTSESHALIAGITGGAIALGNGFSAINMNEWSKVLVGLGVSTVLGFGSGFLFVKLIGLIFRNVRRAAANKFFTGGQIFGAASMAFMHGAQDGQKFMGVFMLALFLNGAASRGADGSFTVAWWLIILCSVTMGLGTSVGGYRIIKAVGMDMVKLEKYQGFAADIAAAGCLLLSSLTGIPVSTTHTKTTAIMGVGCAKRTSTVNWFIVKDMVLAWVLTFPGCGLIGYLMARLCLYIF